MFENPSTKFTLFSLPNAMPILRIPCRSPLKSLAKKSIIRWLCLHLCNSLVIVFNNFFWGLHSHAIFACVYYSLQCTVYFFYFYLFSNTWGSQKKSLFYYSLFYFVHAETLKAKNAAHIQKRHENFAVFLLRPIFLQVFKVKYSKHFFFGVSCCSVVDVFKLLDCFVHRFFSSNASTGSVCKKKENHFSRIIINLKNSWSV